MYLRWEEQKGKSVNDADLREHIYTAAGGGAALKDDNEERSSKRIVVSEYHNWTFVFEEGKIKENVSRMVSLLILQVNGIFHYFIIPRIIKLEDTMKFNIIIKSFFPPSPVLSVEERKNRFPRTFDRESGGRGQERK